MSIDTACVQLITAGLICWRILRANAEMPRMGGRVMNRVLETVIQTGASRMTFYYLRIA